MATLTFPERSRILIVLALSMMTIEFLLTINQDHKTWISFVLAIIISAFIADLFTGLAHFGFDYVFPYNMPILGHVAFEFNEHHAEPTLDPSSYVENFTKGACASLPISVVGLVLLIYAPATPGWFLVHVVILGVAGWALFFHQIHAYAHMGSSLAPEEFNRRIEEISHLSSRGEQMQALRHLFETVPIPGAIRLLQRCRIILSPERHNIHHIRFETGFSSVNGWSDPLLNIFLGPFARRCKARREITHRVMRLSQ